MVTRIDGLSQYQRRYRRAEVLDRWANIYGGKTTAAEWSRFEAARLRLAAEVLKAFHVETVVAWLDARLAKRGAR